MIGKEGREEKRKLFARNHRHGSPHPHSSLSIFVCIWDRNPWSLRNRPYFDSRLITPETTTSIPQSFSRVSTLPTTGPVGSSVVNEKCPSTLHLFKEHGRSQSFIYLVHKTRKSNGITYLDKNSMDSTQNKLYRRLKRVMGENQITNNQRVSRFYKLWHMYFLTCVSL